MKATEKIMTSKFVWLTLIVFVIGVNFLASSFHSRFDLTKEKRYTLSRTTKELIRKLDDDVQIDVFLKGDFPAGFRKLANSTDEFLRLVKDRNGARIHYSFISPQDEIPGVAGRTYEDTLQGLGATYINLSVRVKSGEENKRVYPFILITYKGAQRLVNLYPGGKKVFGPDELNSAEALMEYQFVKALDAVVNPSRPLIAYSVGNGEPTNEHTADLQQSLLENYQLFTFNLSVQKFIPDTFKVLILVKPAFKFSEEEKFKIDQFVMRGGKLLCFIDNLIAEGDSLRGKTETIAYDRGLNLTDLFFRYGARINTDLVMDLQCDFIPLQVNDATNNAQFEFVHWNYYPLFESKGNHPINKNIGLVAGRYVNSIDTIAAEGIKRTVLLSSSPDSRTISTPALISFNENRNAPNDALFKRNAIPTAMLLEGKFTSLYRNRVSGPQEDSLKAAGMSFTGQCVQDNKIIVVADGDMVLNDFSPKSGPLPMGLNFYTVGSPYEYQFANRDFLLNCLEYLVDKPGIIETRNKDIVLRLLDNKKVENQHTTWQFINIGLPVLLIILFGFLYQQIRKRKYAA